MSLITVILKVRCTILTDNLLITEMIVEENYSRTLYLQYTSTYHPYEHAIPTISITFLSVC